MAFARLGKVRPAAKAVSISRDLVYDWLRADANFAADFTEAHKVFSSVSSPERLRQYVWFFFSIAKDYLGPRNQTQLLVDINIALSKLEFKRSLDSTVDASSRKKFRSPSSAHPLGQANPSDDGDRTLQGKNGRSLS